CPSALASREVRMLATALSASIVGVDGIPVRVEVDVSFGLPGLTIVGLAGSAVLEARERVRAAVRNSGFEVPARRSTVNLARAGSDVWRMMIGTDPPGVPSHDPRRDLRPIVPRPGRHPDGHRAPGRRLPQVRRCEGLAGCRRARG